MNVRQLIERHEDRVAYAYPDSLGLLTIGVGHLVDQRAGGSLPDHIIDELLDYDIEEMTAELLQQLPWVRAMDEVRQAVLIDMYFNLRHHLMGFTDTLAALRAQDWPRAAAEMLDSKWARQVGVRATELAAMIKSGEWPK